jgi:glycosyltransferase involved in cell wall biosynthesis
MSPIPIAIFVDRFIPGGTQRQLIELLRRIDKQRFRVHPVCFHDDGPWTSRVSALGDPITKFPISGFAKPATARQLLRFARWCRQNDIAVLHAWEIYSNVFALAGAALAGVPLRIGSRRGLGGPPAVRRLQTLACRTAHRMVANSRAAANQLIDQGIPERRIDIIPNGIDLSMFPVRRDFSRARTITMVACLREGKRIDVLVTAAARVIARYPDVQFQIVGDGPCRERLVEQAGATGVLPRMRFMGHRDDVPAILSASDLFVLPSESEASPNVVLEAMAAALPVVASRVGGIPELVEDGVTGHLVPPGNPDVLATALLDLLDHPSRRAAFGRSGRARIEQQYSFDRMVAQFETLYLSRSAGSASATAHDSERDQCPA